jgi:hypothetical protein
MLVGVVRTVYSFIGITTIPIALYGCGDGGERFMGTPVLDEPEEGVTGDRIANSIPAI